MLLLYMPISLNRQREVQQLLLSPLPFLYPSIPTHRPLTRRRWLRRSRRP